MNDRHAEPRRSEDRTTLEKVDTTLGLVERLWNLAKKGKWLLAAITAVASGVTAVATWAFAQGALPGRITKLEAKVDSGFTAHDTAFAQLRRLLASETDSMRVEIRDLATDLRLMKYMQCTALRRTDPAAAPVQCDEIILDWRRRR